MAVIQSAERLLPAGLRGKAEPFLRALASDDPRNLAQRMALITFAIRVVSEQAYAAWLGEAKKKFAGAPATVADAAPIRQ